MEHLFTPYRGPGALSLPNRLVMAPMTRSRALNNIPNTLMADYYAQRASAGLIITEATSPSPNGLGYARIPGIFSRDQVNGWKDITAAVHDKGGRIFVQLMHTGRVGHPRNLPPGATLLAPSSVKMEKTKIWVDGEGLMEIPAPREMSGEEIRRIIGDHVRGAERAMLAGFDGVELHGANGYLIKQFLNPHINRRTDEYGGNIENRARFALEIAGGIAQAIGREKVGIRLSPFSTVNETPHYPEAEATYHYLATKLDELGIAYLHIVDAESNGAPNALTQRLRQVFRNTFIVAGGYSAAGAEAVLRNNEADLVSFARHFLANPDLVDRFRNKLPLNQPKHDLFYAPGPEGYVDYPVFEDVRVV